MALQQIVHILNNARAKSTILSDALPVREQKVGAVFMLEQKIDFIDKDIHIHASSAILHNPIQDVVEYY